MQLFYTVTIKLKTGEIRSYSFGSSFQSTTFADDIVKLGATLIGIKIGELMTRKEAYNEVKQLSGEDF